MYLVNPDSASKRIHYLPNCDGRCHIDRIIHPIRFRDLRKILTDTIQIIVKYVWIEHPLIQINF